MYPSQSSYAELLSAIVTDQRRSLYWSVLAPWVETQMAERAWLAEFACRPGNPLPPAEVEDLCRLYALSRVNEVLLLPFQQGRADGTDWPGPRLSSDEYLWFAESLGLTVAQPSEFSPFYHEIVSVVQADDEHSPTSVEAILWPSLMLGRMLFSRAGVRVTAGRRLINKDLAEASTLYWAYRRKHRLTQDQSRGWGSNSQWRTRFRRDYHIDSEYFFNVDGKHDMNMASTSVADRDNLTRSERIELLTHRCFVTVNKTHDDLWPYEDTLRIPETDAVLNPKPT